jgi:large subunit ribosomal protein L35
MKSAEKRKIRQQGVDIRRNVWQIKCLMKMKTKKAAAKRFSFTATGKVKFKRMNKRHKLGKKSAAHKLRLRKAGMLFPGDVGHIEKCLPYGSR